MTLFHALVRHRRWVLSLWVVLVVVAGYLSRDLKDLLYGSIGTVRGSEAAQVEATIQRDFRSPYEQSLLVIVEPVANRAPQPKAVQGLSKRLSQLPWVTGVIPATHRTDRAALVIGIKAHSVRQTESFVAPLRSALKQWNQAHPETRCLVTGQAALNLDLVGGATQEASRAESVVIPLTLLALVLTFGALGAASLPLVAGIGATLLAMGVLAVVARSMALSVYASNIVTMLGLGLGVDYALFVVARLREERQAGAAPEAAVVAAVRHAAPAIVSSSATVIIGLTALAAVPAEEPVGLGIGGATVAATSVLASLSLLPAMAALLGSWLEAPRLLSRRLAGAMRGSFWEEVARRILRAPWIALMMAIVVLAALSLPLRHLRLGDPEMESMPGDIESIQAVKVLRSVGQGGLLAPFQVVAETPDHQPILTRDRLEGLAVMTDRLRHDPRIAQVVSLADRQSGLDRLTLGLSMLGERRVRALLPKEAGALLSSNGQAAALYIVPQSSLTFDEVRQLGHDLKEGTWRGIHGLERMRFSLGGPIAFANEFISLTYQVFPKIVLVTLLTTLVAMFAFTRSWIIPLKAVLANTLTVAASMGGTFWVYHTPWTARLMGLSEPMTTISPGIPLLAFCVVFGLSMDYEVFLISRIVEAHRTGFSDHDSIARGLGASGGVITSAAAVMSIVFLGFAFTRFLPLKVLGTALAMGVILDATVVRLLLVPSLMLLVGKWNWWPGDRHMAPQVEVPT